MFSEMPRVLLDSSPNIIYLVDPDLRIAYCNPAWDTFALANAGEHVVASCVTGRLLFDFIAPALQAFYTALFDTCRAQAHSMAFDFECSSANTYRLLRMEVLPLRESGGFALTTSVRVEGTHERAASAPHERYEGVEGIVVMCAHCRRTRRCDLQEQWDWVPQYLADTAIRVSHGVCPICLSYYYQQLPKHLRLSVAQDQAQAQAQT